MARPPGIFVGLLVHCALAPGSIRPLIVCFGVTAVLDAGCLAARTDGVDDEARAFTTYALEGETVRLTYDVECRDKYDRLLAYVERVSDDGDLNRALVAYGYACVLHIQPNGNEHVDEFRELEAQAQAEGKGMWGACSNPC